MINEEQYELHKGIVEWLMAKGCPFIDAMSTISLAEESNLSIPIAFFRMLVPQEKNNCKGCGR